MGAPVYKVRQSAARIGIVGMLTLPIWAGLVQTLAAAFGWIPEMGMKTVTIQAIWLLLEAPGFWPALRLTVVTAVVATLVSLLLAFALFARLGGHRPWFVTPLLATPHAALGLGLAFLIAPAGWLMRAFGQLLGWTSPPAIVTVGDPFGLALMLGLVVKEVPFLLLMMLAVRLPLPVGQQMAAGRSLGHSAASVWIKVIFPQIYLLIRLPLFIVLAFSLSVVDLALILGPGVPPPLAVLLMRWFLGPDPAMIAPASMGAVLLMVLAAGLVMLWIMAERLLAHLGRGWLRRGGRGRRLHALIAGFAAVARLALVLGVAALGVLALWSVSLRWPFPHLLPDFSVMAWQAADWADPFVTTLALGLASTAVALVLAILVLEAEDAGLLPRGRWLTAVILIPVLVPQIALLPGIYRLALPFGMTGGFGATVWAHVIFVFPYVFLALADPWRRLDPRMIHVAAALGAGRARRLWRLKLPLLLGPLAAGAALGLAVSAGQYLSTLFLGAGRVQTLATEAVALASGADRRAAAAHGVVLALLPLAAYTVAIWLPRHVFRYRRDMLTDAAP